MFSVLNEYPLITVRKQHQLHFAIKCIIDANYYYKWNKLKYEKNIDLSKLSFENIPYFSAWLSGFVEAEGNFKVNRYKDSNNIRSRAFQIGQNGDLHVLGLIKEYFKSYHTITTDKTPNIKGIYHHRISIGGPICNTQILNHFCKYPLLGEKIESFNV